MDKSNIIHTRGGQDKVAVVTGGGSQGSGIGNGRAASILLAERGYTVLVVDKSLDSAEETCRMIAADGGRAVAVAADVSQPDDCESVIEQATALDGTLEVLVNNVGVVGPPGTVVDVDRDGEGDVARFAQLHDERLLAALGVPGEGAVGEAATGGLVDHVHDPHRRTQAQPPHAQAQVRDRSGLDPRVRCHHRDPGSTVHLPRHQSVCGPPEVRPPRSNPTAAAQLVEPVRHHARARAPDGGVGDGGLVHVDDLIFEHHQHRARPG